MARTYLIEHRTMYAYGAAMTDGYTVASLMPRPTERQTVFQSEVRLDPAASETDTYLDPFGNLIHQFGIHEPHDHLSVIATSEVTVLPAIDPVDFTPVGTVVDQLDHATGDLAFETGWYRSTSPLIDLDVLAVPLAELVASHFDADRPIVEAITSWCEAIFTGFEFDPQSTIVSTPLGDVLAERRGVCQDFAHLAIAGLRSVGLAARYVSGYIETVPPPGQDRLIGADASHAWCSVWTPMAGWVDIDPTNGHVPADDHITVAWGRDYGDVTPVRGVVIGPSTTQSLDVAVDVVRQ